MIQIADAANSTCNTRSRRDQVLELIAKRRSLKQIARALNISESTVNYHIRTLKESYGVNTLAQLADVYSQSAHHAANSIDRFSTSQESAVPFDPALMTSPVLDAVEPAITFHDSLRMNFDAPWIDNGEPVVVPGVLNGTNATLRRGAVILGFALGLLAMVLLGLGVAQGITAALAGVEANPA